MKAPLPIERITPINKKDFYNTYVRQGRPVVISGLTTGWLGNKLWDFDYFLDRYAKTEIKAFRLNNKGECDVDVKKGSPTRDIILEECLRSIADLQIEGKWSIASAIDLFPEQLSREFSAPLYCADGRFLRSMIFIGPAGVVAPLHQDLPENMYVMVRGKKRITLFAPADHVYPNSRLSNLPNHSQIDALDPDYARFPKAIDAQPYIVDLAAGETLFIPSFWWHHLRSLEPSIALNFWWSQGWKLPIAWAASLYKKWRAI
jgi:hypothetical protein